MRATTEVLFAALVAVAALSGCSSQSKPSCDAQCESNIAAASTTHVSYRLTGNASDGADITYSLADHGQEQQQGVGVPLTNKETGAPGIDFDASFGDFLYFSAQNAGSGTLTCEIVEDGKVLTRHTSSGDYAIVTCQATA